MTERTANIQGFSEDLRKSSIPIGTSVTAATTDSGETIVLQANEALQLPTNKFSILSATQLREYGVTVDDVAKRHGGTQSIVAGGYTFPLQLASGLLTIPLRVPTDQ